MNQVAYIDINGQIWKLLEDGSLEPLAPGETPPLDAKIIGLEDLEATASAGNAASGNSLLSSTPSSTDSSGSGSSLFGSISRSGEELLASAGYQTVGPNAIVTATANNNNDLVGRLDPNATISININDDDNIADNFVNRFENPAIDFFGGSTNIEDGWIIELTLVDSLGQVFNAEATNLANAWSLLNQDLTALAQGPFTATATARDIYGNSVSDSVSSIKDTLAEGIAVSADTGVDSVINLFEAESARLSGEFSNVQAGAEVLITATDSNGLQLQFSSNLDSSGRWQINEDLRTLTEGTIQLNAQTQDLAGNPASSRNTVELRLSPTISIDNIDADGVFNRVESGAQNFFGGVFNVEDGQPVELVITDSSGGSVTAIGVVNDSIWSIQAVNLSGLDDGPLTAIASTANQAGATASADLTRDLDQTTILTANFIDPNQDSVYNAAEALSASLAGVAIDIEVGQPVFLIISDGLGWTQAGITQVGVGQFWSLGNLDLSGAQSNTLTVNANSIDRAGNTVSASASIAYDPLAVINNVAVDNQDNDNDQLFNAAEVTSGVLLEGTTRDIEPNQAINVTVTDAEGKQIIATATVQADGRWVVDSAVDLSTLKDGNLTVLAEGSDLAGNPASGSDTIEKDVVAAITVAFDQNTISASNVEAITVSGTITDVEVGRQIQVTISDNDNTTADVTLTGTVGLGGRWSGDNSIDLSTLLDGTLNVVATTKDIAGNPANAANNAIKDAVTVTIRNDDVDGVFNIAEASLADFYGETTFVANGGSLELTITDSQGRQVTENTLVTGNTWRIDDVNLSGLADGPMTATAVVTNNLGDTDSAQLSRDIDQTIGVSAEFVDDNNDSVYNLLEGKSVKVEGTVNDIENGREVSLSITDSNGKAIAFVDSLSNPISNIVTIVAGQWSLDNLDLSAAAPGLLTITATSSDAAGNTDSNTDTITYDPLAAIDDVAVDNQDNDNDQLINAAEVTAGVMLEGTTSGIEPNQAITVTITDDDGKQVIAAGTVQSDGRWILDTAVNLSSLKDGDLTVLAEGSDLAGNAASGSDTIEKDVLASLTVQFDGDGKLSASEISKVTISGTSVDIEPGRTVNVIISGAGATSISFTAEIQADGRFASNSFFDLSGFDDGTLTVSASTTDAAGNPANNSNTVIKDVLVNIDIDTGAYGLDIAQTQAGIATTYRGSTDAEEGQEVTLTFSDGSISETFTTEVLAGGNWQTLALTPSQLNPNVSWTLAATVNDQAGNTAVDDTPTLAQPQSAILSEASLVNGVDVAVSAININVGGDPTLNANPFTFSDASRQLALAGLTSSAPNGDSSTSVDVSTDGKTIQLIRNGDSFVVLEGFIGDAAKTVTLTLRGGIEQAVGLDIIRSSLLVKVTQNDVAADPNADAVEATLNFAVEDGLAFAEDDNFQVIEDVTTSGNLFDNDNKLEGPLEITSIDFGGNNYTVTFASAALINTGKGTLTVQQNGDWSFAAARGQDHSGANPEVSFSYNAVDADGDIDSADVTLEIIDGASGLAADITVNNRESNLDSLPAPAQLGSISGTIVAGSDNLVPDSIAFDPATILWLNSQGYQSNGNDVVFTLSSNNKIITAMASGQLVYTSEIIAEQSANGQDLDARSSNIWYAALDHSNLAADTLALKYLITASDTDGTAINPAVITVNFGDGDNPQIINSTGVSLDEDNLDNPSPSITGTGTLAINMGSDALSDFMFAETSAQPALSSNGEAIIYSLSANGLTLIGFVSDVSVPGNEVFRVVLDRLVENSVDSSVNYTVTLSQALDQVNLNGGDDGNIHIPLKVLLTDFDRDTTSVDLDIVVNDAAAATVSDVSLSVTEIPKTVSSGLTNSATDTITISAGKDKIESAEFGIVDGAAITTEAGIALSSNGNSITWRDNGNGTLDAIANGTTVFTVTLPASVTLDAGSSLNIPIKLEIFGVIDHLPAVTDLAQIALPLNFIDSDGTQSTANASLSLADGLDPVAVIVPNAKGNLKAIVVQERDLNDGQDQASKNTVEGTKGSDAFAGFDVRMTTNNLFTSDGTSVKLSQLDNFTWQGNATDGRKVFQLSLDANGQESFELYESILHQRNNGTPTNNKTLSFKVAALDADGDKSPEVNLKVRVKDDTPLKPKYDNILEFTEGDTVSGNVLRGVNVSREGDFGEDGGEVDEIRYLGASYRFNDDGSGAAIGDPLIIQLTAQPLLADTSFDYGTLTINRDGSYVIDTSNVPNTLGVIYLDSFDFDIIDLDGDTKNNITFNFGISDANGIITLSPRETTEDVPVTLNLTGSPGDIDQNETVTGFIFDSSKLQGGTLSLNGTPLGKDGDGNYILTSSQLTLTGSGVDAEVKPDGDLVFTPFADSSNQTAAVSIDISMIVSAISGSLLVEKSFDFSVISDADAPLWSATANYNIDIDEDSGSNAINPAQATISDTDTSEQLSYRISAIDSGIALSSSGKPIVVGDSLTEAQFNALSVTPSENISGLFNYSVEAIATEQENNDSASTEQTFTVSVAGVADIPTLTVRNVKGTEDVPLNIADIIRGNLNDNDGSERLWFELTVPSGWSVSAPNMIHVAGTDIYRVSDADLKAGSALLIPKEDLSRVTEIASISVRAVAEDLPKDGVLPDTLLTFSASKSFTVNLKGVADAPDIGPGTNGNWQYDNNSKIISASADFNEDSRIPLDFDIHTEDQDGSESISLHLSGLPTGSELYNGAGELQFLPVFDASTPNNPVYTVTLAQMSDLYFEPPKDYSGAIELNLEQINTEPDGDSAAFDLTIQFNVAPVIDTKSDQLLSASGLEDSAKPLNLMPVLADNDGSETITELTILPGFEGSLLLDGTALVIPAGGLALSSLSAGNLETLLTSGRINFIAPEDRHGNFKIDFSYEITDSNAGISTDSTNEFNGSITVDVRAQVEQKQTSTSDDTRIETASGVLSSTNGNPIDLTGQVLFFEEDLDGSETLDYLLIKMPNPTGWYIDNPSAIHDGLGNWMITAPVTSTSVQEQALSLLDGIKIYSEYAFSGSIEVEARVLDGSEGTKPDDADIISGLISVDFKDPGANSTIAFDPNTLQDSIADGLEGQNIDLSGHILSDIRNLADDTGNDKISFRVEPADFISAGIPGAQLAATGMRIHYGADGSTILAFVFDQAALADLTLTGVDGNLAGDISLPITVIATDPSGNTLSERQDLDIDLLPVVDELLTQAPKKADEDQPFRLDLGLLLGDKDTDASRGIETIESIVFSNLGGGRLADPLNVLIDNNDGSFTLNEPAQIGAIFYLPPEHVSGQSSFNAALTITDTTTGGGTSANQVTAVKNTTLTFELEPVTDIAAISVPLRPMVGQEDTSISLSSLSASLIDQDGSETISLQITGVPTGAVLYSGGVQLPNNGTDGGSISGGDLDGVATYSWTVTEAQLANLTIVPPQDFSGQLTLNLQAITNEKGTGDFVTTSKSFTVAVVPFADGVQLTNPQVTAEGAESDSITISLGAETLENTNPNEVVELTVTALSSSNSSALFELDRIIADSITGRFNDNGNGSFTATVLTTVASLASFDLVAGDLAWGDLNLQVDVSSVDQNQVLGQTLTNTSANESFNLTVTIAAKPDPALLSRDFDGVIGSNGTNIPMGLELDILAVNIAPGEAQQLVIQGLPNDFSFNHGNRSGNLWIVDANQVSDLELDTTNIAGSNPIGDFTLVLNSQASLNGETVSGPSQVIDVKIQAAGDNTLIGTDGDDSYTGGTGADIFTWRDGDEGSILFPNHDSVRDFNKGSGTYSGAEGDQLDLSGLLTGLGITDGNSANAIINIKEESGNTQFEIQVDSIVGHNQIITLEGVSKNDLVPGGYSDDADFLQQLIDNNTLLTQ